MDEVDAVELDPLEVVATAVANGVEVERYGTGG